MMTIQVVLYHFFVRNSTGYKSDGWKTFFNILKSDPTARIVVIQGDFFIQPILFPKGESGFRKVRRINCEAFVIWSQQYRASATIFKLSVIKTWNWHGKRFYRQQHLNKKILVFGELHVFVVKSWHLIHCIVGWSENDRHYDRGHVTGWGEGHGGSSHVMLPWLWLWNTCEM